ncbi:hypothetical protein [Desulfosarcina sp.]|uniref:hypothetical protein n=1 Tax=Desulfosarcina sp. TaxID=2027861 RepID=UPI003568E7EC
MALPQAQAAMHDLVILYGRVIEPETSLDGVRNVGVKDGKIVPITSAGIGGKIYQRRGACGRIWFYRYSFPPPPPHGVKLALRTGVTTGMDLELGALEIDMGYGEKQKAGRQINFATTISHEFVWQLLLVGVAGAQRVGRDLPLSGWINQNCVSYATNGKRGGESGSKIRGNRIGSN